MTLEFVHDGEYNKSLEKCALTLLITRILLLTSEMDLFLMQISENVDDRKKAAYLNKDYLNALHSSRDIQE